MSKIRYLEDMVRAEQMTAEDAARVKRLLAHEEGTGILIYGLAGSGKTCLLDTLLCEVMGGQCMVFAPRRYELSAPAAFFFTVDGNRVDGNGLDESSLPPLLEFVRSQVENRGELGDRRGGLRLIGVDEIHHWEGGFAHVAHFARVNGATVLATVRPESEEEAYGQLAGWLGEKCDVAKVKALFPWTIQTTCHRGRYRVVLRRTHFGDETGA